MYYFYIKTIAQHCLCQIKHLKGVLAKGGEYTSGKTHDAENLSDAVNVSSDGDDIVTIGRMTGALIELGAGADKVNIEGVTVGASTIDFGANGGDYIM